MNAQIDPGTYDLESDVHKITDYRCVSSDMQHMSIKPRLYLHLDLNCYYAQLEQQCFNLHGMPVYIGGWYKPNGIARGIVATCSYEARGFGIKTGMSAFEAEQLCPWAIGLQVHYEKYKAVSRHIEELLNEFAPTVEKYSMDEFFLDINYLADEPEEMIRRYAKRLRKLVHKELGLVGSVGVATSKTYSKLASDLDKPNGQAVILTKEQEKQFIHPLPCIEMWGIGSRRYRKLQKERIYTLGEAIERGYQVFQRLFGSYFGKIMWEMAAGKDRARVLTDSHLIPEELFYHHTFSDWSDDPIQVHGEIMKAISILCYRMRGYNLRARSFFCQLGIQSQDKKGISFRFNTDGFTNLDDYIFYECIKKAGPLIKKILKAGHTLRRAGLGTIRSDRTGQQDLFFREEAQKKHFYLSADAVNNRYGKGTITKAAALDAVPGKTHFLDRS